MMLKVRPKKFKDDGRKTDNASEKPTTPNRKIEDPNTVYTYIEYFRKLSIEMHMEYTNITLEIRAVITLTNLYGEVWAVF